MPKKQISIIPSSLFMDALGLSDNMDLGIGPSPKHLSDENESLTTASYDSLSTGMLTDPREEEQQYEIRDAVEVDKTKGVLTSMPSVSRKNNDEEDSLGSLSVGERMIIREVQQSNKLGLNMPLSLFSLGRVATRETTAETSTIVVFNSTRKVESHLSPHVEEDESLGSLITKENEEISVNDGLMEKHSLLGKVHEEEIISITDSAETDLFSESSSSYLSSINNRSLVDCGYVTIKTDTVNDPIQGSIILVRSGSSFGGIFSVTHKEEIQYPSGPDEESSISDEVSSTEAEEVEDSTTELEERSNTDVFERRWIDIVTKVLSEKSQEQQVLEIVNDDESLGSLISTEHTEKLVNRSSEENVDFLVSISEKSSGNTNEEEIISGTDSLPSVPAKSNRIAFGKNRTSKPSRSFLSFKRSQQRKATVASASPITQKLTPLVGLEDRGHANDPVTLEKFLVEQRRNARKLKKASTKKQKQRAEPLIVQKEELVVVLKEKIIYEPNHRGQLIKKSNIEDLVRSIDKSSDVRNRVLGVANGFEIVAHARSFRR